MEGDEFGLAMKQDKRSLVLQLLTSLETPNSYLDTNPLILSLLEQFQQVFVEPIGISLKRDYDHHITLQPNAKPVSVGPYRYPYFQNQKLKNSLMACSNLESFIPVKTHFSLWYSQFVSKMAIGVVAWIIGPSIKKHSK